MAIVNPIHLLEQGERLLRPRGDDKLIRQADRRRAISASYYAVFHFTLAAVADQFVGKANRKTALYARVYRSIDHGSLNKLCKKFNSPQALNDLSECAPQGGFGPNIKEFASLAAQLKEKRELADYDPTQWVTIADARKAIAEARSAIARFGNASTARRRAFLTLIIFSAR